MTAGQYRTLLLKHWRLIILCSVLMGAAVGLGSLFISSPYQSTATLQLVYLPAHTPTPTSATETLQTELNLVTSDSILSQVAAHYPGLTVGQLKSEIVAQAVSTTRLIQITVSDHDASRASHLANDLAAALISQQEQTTQQANAQSQQPLLDSLAATQKQIDTDQATLNSLQANPQANQEQIQKLQSDLKNLQMQYDQELQTLTSLQNDEAVNTNYLQVVGAAQPSSKPVHSTSWHLAVGAAGLGLGLLVGMSLVLLRDWFDQQLPTESALSELLGWTVLEEVDLAASNKAAVAESAGRAASAPDAPYHLLSQNLAFLGIETPFSSLAVTSTLADSKAANVVAGGLASSLSRGGKRVLLVDANFARPSQHRRFGTPAEPGLGAAVLAFSASSQAEQSLEPYLYPAHTDSSLLRVLPAGPIPPNPRQVLKSRGMQEVFRACNESGADVVVTAGPPVTGSAGTCTWAALAEGVIVVIGRSHARKTQLLRMKQSLEEAGARVLGCVVWGNVSNQSQYAEQPDVVAGTSHP